MIVVKVIVLWNKTFLKRKFCSNEFLSEYRATFFKGKETVWQSPLVPRVWHNGTELVLWTVACLSYARLSCNV